MTLSLINCIDRGSTQFSQPRPEMTNSPKWSLCYLYDWDQARSFLKLIKVSLEPIFLEEMTLSWVELQCNYASLWNRDCITSGNLSPPNYTMLKYTEDTTPSIRLLEVWSRLMKSICTRFSFWFLCVVCFPVWHLQGHSQLYLLVCG